MVMAVRLYPQSCNPFRVDRLPKRTHRRRAIAPSLAALRCAARLQAWWFSQQFAITFAFTECQVYVSALMRNGGMDLILTTPSAVEAIIAVCIALLVGLGAFVALT